MPDQWNHKVFKLDKTGFERIALEVFRFQQAQNTVYRNYLDVLGIDPASVLNLDQVPFLPVGFFKTHDILTTEFTPGLIFESSGTTGSVTSRHLVKDISLYEESFSKGFEMQYGPVSDWCIIGLLPSYLEREHSSLVYMVNHLVRQTGHANSGFYLHEYAQLASVLEQLEKAKQKTLLIGVTYALLDFAERYPLPLKSTIIMETGGMKGRRREMIRKEVHDQLKQAFGVPVIHSEYGMTELLSQAYSKGEGVFNCPPWMKVVVREEEDPFLNKSEGTGIINIIDLANVYSCSFIATDDAGKLYPDGSFEVLGRVDGSDIRGCSLLAI